MKLKELFNRRHFAVDDHPTIRKHIPWISSPLQNDTSHGESYSTGSSSSLRPKAQSHGKDKLPPFQHRHESSTIELFYDLFFVANLATFTNNHEIVDSKSLRNYLGYFTILWFTWLQTSLFDVRFGSDSIVGRIFNCVSFGVMTGFAVVGAIYDTTHLVENVKAFRAMSIILMVSRLALIVQYGIILFFVRKYNHTHVPLLGTMAVLFLTAMAYLGTFWGFDVDALTDVSSHGGDPHSSQPRTYYAWYGIAVAEAAAVITISSIWRVVSFKRTHLVERVGLLSLIIMGEGIIGMAKSVSQILQTSRETSSSDIGNIIAAVLLIYFIWVLYFDQIENERFGTIRQQIWAILHFPLHVAILLTVEGAASMIIWNILSRYIFYWIQIINDAPNNANSTAATVEYIETGINVMSDLFKESHLSLVQAYDYGPNLTAIANISAPFNSTEWVREYTTIATDLGYGVSNAIFIKFGIEGPVQDPSVHLTQAQTFEVLANVFSTVFAYIYIAAGSFVLALAVLYWFGKTNKSLAEWYAIGMRVALGLGLCAFCAISFVNSPASDDFTFSAWPLPIVTLMYFIVILLDNLILWRSNSRVRKRNVGAQAGMVDAKMGSGPTIAEKDTKRLPEDSETAV